MSTNFGSIFIAIGLFAQALLGGFTNIVLTTFGPGGSYLASAIDSLFGSFGGIADALLPLDAEIASFFTAFANVGTALNNVLQFVLFDGVEVFGFEFALYPLAESVLSVFGVSMVNFSIMPLVLTVALIITVIFTVMSAVLAIISLVTNFVLLFA